MRQHFKPSIYILAVMAFIFTTDASNSQYRFIPTTQVDKTATEIASRFTNEPTRFLTVNIPDSAEIVSAYKNAKTVMDIEAGNEQVVHALAKMKSAEGALSRLAAIASSCDQTKLPDVATFQATMNDMEGNSTAFEAALTDIERRMKKSLQTMQSNAALDRSGRKVNPDFRRNEQLRRYQIAYSDFGRLRVQAQESRKGISRASHGLLNAQCQPEAIPPLYEGEKVVLPQAAKKPPRLNP